MTQKYSLINNVTGWIVFVAAAIVYLLTLEPSVSLWDCGEFIATAHKLEVGHPPGAPMFLMLARFFSIFAGENYELVARMVNTMSGLSSALTILFLYWTITRLAKKMVPGEMNVANMIAVIGSGVVGALAYTFSDTFWFSAVEGEVYALSSLFTAVVFWAILRWEDNAFDPGSDKWLVLIAYLMGLSIGVHLLNLLAIPAIVFVYYFKKFELSRKGIIIASVISIVSIAFVMWGVIQGSIKVASRLELLFVNSLGMPFNSGLFIYLILLVGAIVYSLYSTSKEKMAIPNTIALTAAAILVGIPFMSGGWFLAIILIGAIAVGIYKLSEKYSYVLNTATLILTVIVIGYSSYAMIVIRSYANTPMDENNPENVFTLLSYLNREQYGDRPLMYGPYYNAPVKYDQSGKPVIKDEKSTWIQKGDKYEKVSLGTDYEYDSRFTTIFPRMYSTQDRHVNEYKKWGKIEGKAVKTNDGTVRCPTFGENLRFFFKYQIGHMYMRYFMWNFSGRQNDIQGHGGILDGNWITGINAIDSMFIGNQDEITDIAKEHPARNKYYMLPFLFGLIGFLFQLKRNPKDFTTVMLLFFFTGIAIVVYLNQTPIQPRERDYAYAGSFYAYAIWIGLAVIGIFKGLFEKKTKSAGAAVVAVALVGIAPTLMGTENWDDHDRSGRYTAHDFAANYLETCEPNALIFTAGDNDTFPLWYAQEVEGIRTDVRVVCLPLLSTDWYAEQMIRKAYESDPIPVSMTRDKFVQGTRDYCPLFERDQFKGKFLPLKKVMNFVLNDDESSKVRISNGEMINYFPAKDFLLPVDKDQVVKAGAVPEELKSSIVDEIKFSLKGRYVLKNELIILDILDDIDWTRPLYYTSIHSKETMGLDNYMRYDGFAYKFVPVRSFKLANASEFLNKKIQGSNKNMKERGEYIEITRKLQATGKFDTPIDTKEELEEIVRTALGEKYASYLPVIMKNSASNPRINTDLMYDNLMNRYKWGRMEEEDVHIDHFNQRTMRVIGIRSMFGELAKALVEENKLDSANAVLDKCMTIVSHKKVPFDVDIIPIIDAFYAAKQVEKANAVLQQYAYDCYDELEFYASLDPERRKNVKQEEQRSQYIIAALVEKAKQNGQQAVADAIDEMWQTESLKESAE